MPPLDLLGTFQDPLNLDQGAGKLVNVRVVPRSQAAEGKPAKVRLLGAPGLTQVCKPTSSPCIVIGHALETIWSGHADGSIYHGVETATPIFSGFVAVNANQPIIRFAEDRTALVIASNLNLINPGVSGGTGYIVQPPNMVTNANLDASINFDPTAVAELDNQTLWSGASNFYTNQDAKIYRSQPLNPSNVQPNSFGTKEARGDRVVDLAVSGRIFWPLGSRSLEQWYDNGANTDMPFVPYPNSLISVGLAARLSLAVLRDLIVFVATDRRIWVCTGQSGQPSSPAWVDLLLQQLTLAQLATLTGYAYGQGGSDFYVLTLPGQWSLELSSSTGAWSYRQSPGRLDHAGRCATEHDGGSTYVGLDTGEICLLNINSATEPGGTLSRTMITPWVGGAPAKNMLTSGTGQEETRNTVDAIDVTSSMGPQAGTFQLDWSETNDVTVNGVLVTPRTWRGLREIAMPQPGMRRAVGRNFGSSRRRQFRFRYGGTQAPFTVDELFAQITGGN
jgi:hypothetical protein